MKEQIIALKVDGMDCANCAKSITRFLERKGFEEVYVNFQTKEVRFQENEELLSLDGVSAGIRKLGFSVIDEQLKEPWWNLKNRLIVAAIFTLPLLIHHLLMMVGTGLPGMYVHIVQLLFCIPVYLIGVEYFGKSAWKSLQTGVPNMDVLIFIGATAAFIYSITGTILNADQYIFYETAATIITLVLLGNWMEHQAVARTTSAIGELSALQQTNAKRLMPSGSIVSIGHDEINAGQILIVNEGDVIPSDGYLEKGRAWVDESMISGESDPILKQAGDFVIGGSLLKEGNIHLKVSAIGKQSVLGQMIELVKTAQQDKPDIQRLADRISAIFVPAVLIISLLTFLVGYFAFSIDSGKALMNAIAVLVISCPCAMGLATPTAVMVGVGRMARNGILVKGGQTIEVLSNVKNIIFDKTGTLTTGNFSISNIEYFDQDKSMIHCLLLAMEQHSSHPIAKSIVNHLENIAPDLPTFPLERIEEQKGIGLLAFDMDGNEYELGSNRMVPVGKEKDGNVFLLKNGSLLCCIHIEDNIKEDAYSLIRFLKKKNIQPIILSGDQTAKTQVVAQKLDIPTFFGEYLPEEKLKKVQEYKDKGITAMVGDGINDAPALAKADVGISLSGASKIAIQSAEIVLMNGQLAHIEKALGITKHTVLTIKQNLFWAFAYNLVAIPMAAMGFLNPMWGALFMAFSDVVVIGNSLRLRVKKIK